jgi:hypothetical protein
MEIIHAGGRHELFLNYIEHFKYTVFNSDLLCAGSGYFNNLLRNFKNGRIGNKEMESEIVVETVV